MPIIYLKRTSLKVSGLGFKTIQAKTLNIVLSINEDIIVDKLFLNHKKRLFDKSAIFLKNQTSKYWLNRYAIILAIKKVGKGIKILLKEKQ